MSEAIILSVDDSSDDFTLLKLACEAVNVSFQLLPVQSGEAAIAYLESTRDSLSQGHFPVPDMILLDLKMPGKSGFDVLTWLRAQPEFARLPVVILTSSTHAEDRARALSLGATWFLVKPIGYGGLQRIVRSLDQLLQTKAAPDSGTSLDTPSSAELAR
jgi:DNA-binding response OmpR family regulator